MSQEKPEFKRPIPVSAIAGIRLSCKHCGVAIIMPLETTREVPAKCFSCGHEFPYRALQDFMREFRYMKDAAGKSDVTFMVHLEQEE